MQTKSYFIVLALLLLMDIAWLAVNKERYGALVKSVQGSKLDMVFWAAIASYLCVYVLLVMFVLPFAEKMKTSNKLYVAVRFGGLVGLLVYGIFNFTNIAIFKRYSLSVAALDTLWGFVLFTLITYIHIQFV